MKILHTVESYYPSVGGMQEVVKRLSELLVIKGHKVFIATSKHNDRSQNLINGVKIVEFDISGNYVYGYKGDPGNQNQYIEFVKKGKFDIVTNFAAQQWATDLLLPHLKELRAKKVFVPTGFSGLFNKDYNKYFELLKKWVKAYDMNIFLSEDYRDINYYKYNHIDKRIIIPNGASEKEFESRQITNLREKLHIPKHHLLITTLGSHTGIKGHFEAMQIFKKSRIKYATLLIIGNKMEGGCYQSCKIAELKSKIRPDFLLNSKQIIVADLDRIDTINALHNSDLFIFPSNIECSPIVLFEALASKTPFMTSDVGNSKEIIKWTGGGLLLDTSIDSQGYSRVNIEKAAKSLFDLSYDFKSRKQLAVSGYNAWKSNFTWEIIADKYDSLYRSLSTNKIK